MKVPDCEGKRDLGGNSQLKDAVANCCCHLANKDEEIFRVLRNYFGARFHF